MNIKPTQNSRKIFEYQEACKTLREMVQERRAAITFFGFIAVFHLGIVYSRFVAVDMGAYLSVSGIVLTFTSFLLFVKYTKAIKHIRDQLITLQDTLGYSVYSSSVHASFSERNFYIFIYALVGFAFLVTSVTYIRDASNRHYLMFQSCGPFAEITYGDEGVSCPCGEYPPLTDIVDACPTLHPNKGK